MEVVQLAAQAGTSLTGALTVVGTLTFVAACFVVVEVVDRRSHPTASARVVSAGGSDSHDLGADGPGVDILEGRARGVVRSTGHPVPVNRAIAVSCIGLVTAGLVGATLIPLRATVGQAGIALSLVLVVTAAAAVGGRLAAAITSAGAALTFNLLHTEPYLTFHIDHSVDLVTSVLMILVGVAVGEVSQRNFDEQYSSDERNVR